jgi:hypothetical protein
MREVYAEKGESLFPVLIELRQKGGLLGLDKLDDERRCEGG